MPSTPKPEFYVCRIVRTALVPQGVLTSWVPLGRTVQAADAASAVASVRSEVGPGEIIAFPVSSAYTAAAVQTVEMTTTTTNIKPI